MLILLEEQSGGESTQTGQLEACQDEDLRIGSRTRVKGSTWTCSVCKVDTTRNWLSCSIVSTIYVETPYFIRDTVSHLEEHLSRLLYLV